MPSFAVAGGFLSGKYNKNENSKAYRTLSVQCSCFAFGILIMISNRYWKDANFAAVDAIRLVAEKK